MMHVSGTEKQLHVSEMEMVRARGQWKHMHVSAYQYFLSFQRSHWPLRVLILCSTTGGTSQPENGSSVREPYSLKFSCGELGLLHDQDPQ